MVIHPFVAVNDNSAQAADVITEHVVTNGSEARPVTRRADPTITGLDPTNMLHKSY
jgi:hypothetical protein